MTETILTQELYNRNNVQQSLKNKDVIQRFSDVLQLPRHLQKEG